MIDAQILVGDCRDVLPTLPAGSVQCCVTSPPYWGLRDYGTATWEGGEPGCDHSVSNANNRLMLGSDGAYAGAKIGNTNGGDSSGLRNDGRKEASRLQSNLIQERNMSGMTFSKPLPPGLKSKDLCGIPWRLAFALQADGWYLRSDIIWHKPNPMPESVTDRPTKAHEYIFLLSKAERYYYDSDAIREPHSRDWSNGRCGGSLGPNICKKMALAEDDPNFRNGHSQWERDHYPEPNSAGRNKRSVWTIATQPYADAHFATFPEDLIKPCILAGSRLDDVVLDPFGGSGTTGKVALELGRSAILIELSPLYAELAAVRTNVTPGFL